jgi:hypothetical protein
MRHSSSPRARCFAVILFGAIAWAQTAPAMRLSDANPPSAVSATDPGAARSIVHLSAQALQAIFLNGLRLGAQKTARSAKVTSCRIAGWYTDDGTVQVVQLVKASGLPLVDQACMQGMIGQRLARCLPGRSRNRLVRDRLTKRAGRQSTSQRSCRQLTEKSRLKARQRLRFCGACRDDESWRRLRTLGALRLVVMGHVPAIEVMTLNCHRSSNGPPGSDRLQ